MDTDMGSDLLPWLKMDLLGGFSDLLDNERMVESDLTKNAATLGSSDLLSLPSTTKHVDFSSDQASHSEWLKSIIAPTATPVDIGVQPQISDALPFPGFPAAGLLTSVPAGAESPQCTAPIACNRIPMDAGLTAPSSWDSSFTSYTLESSLADLASVPDVSEKPSRKLKSENSFDSLGGSLCRDASRDDFAGAHIKSRDSNLGKASLADRNRERQQRFRQRQKAKIESLEMQVTKLTSQSKALMAEKEDLNGRASKLADLLHARDRALVKLNSQLSQLRCLNGGEGQDIQQLTLTYCNPPLVISAAQLAKMGGQDLGKVWKEYVWLLSSVLPKGEPGCCDPQWTPVSERLDALTSELVQLMMHLWDTCPDFARIKAGGVVEEDVKAQDQEAGRWRQIANCLSLSFDQIQSLLALQRTMRSRLRQIWAERREAHTNLLSCLEEELASSRDIATQHLKVKQNRDTLDEGIKKESLLSRDFEFAFYKKVLRPDQRAHCIVQSFPYFPDCQAIANWVAADTGDQEAQSLMTMHATSSTTSYHSNS